MYMNKEKYFSKNDIIIAISYFYKMGQTFLQKKTIQRYIYV